MHATSLGVTRGWAKGGAKVHRAVPLGVGERAQYLEIICGNEWRALGLRDPGHRGWWALVSPG